MTVREELENIERLTLSDKACFSAGAGRRRVTEDPDPIRTAFQRDRDRILHCNSFRRLKHKTQVFLDPVGDHYRTRLTHSLEVSQIARTICRAMHLNEDLTEAIALGHDIGHTPFGHAGEAALNDISSCGFKHYLQSVRVLDYIEKDGKGLNLTWEVRNGIACHTDRVAATKEGYIVRLADKIAYVNHDIDDAIRAGILTESELPKASTDILGSSKSERITTLIMALVENGSQDIHYPAEIEKALDILYDYLFAHVYRNNIAKDEEAKAQTLVKSLYEYFCRHPEKMPPLYTGIAERFSRERAVCDYISGMSDGYAVDMYNSLFIPSSWHLK